MLTILGACAVTFMMMLYELRAPPCLVHLRSCARPRPVQHLWLSRGHLAVGVVEAIWVGIARRRYVQLLQDARRHSAEVHGPPTVSAEPDPRPLASAALMQTHPGCPRSEHVAFAEAR